MPETDPPPPDVAAILAEIRADPRVREIALARLAAFRADSRVRWEEDPRAFRMENRTVGLLGDRWYRDVFEPWQEANIFEPMDAGKDLWCEAPRGHDRTDAVGWTVCYLLEYRARRWRRIVVAASDGDQARLDLERCRRYVLLFPALFPHVAVQENRVVRYDDDGNVIAECVVLAADAPGSLGELPSLIILEELAAWADTKKAVDFKDSLVGAAAKGTSENPIPLWVLTNAGSGKKGNWRWEIREQFRLDAARDPDRVHFWSAPDWVAPWSLSEMERLQGRMTKRGRARFCHNRWLDTDESPFFEDGQREAVFSRAFGREVPGIVATALGCDYGLTKDAAAVSVVGITRDRAYYLLFCEAWAGTPEDPVKYDAVEPVLLACATRFRIESSAIDDWQMANTIQRHGTALRVRNGKGYKFSPALKREIAAALGQPVRNGAFFANRGAGRRTHRGRGPNGMDEVYDLEREMIEAVEQTSGTGAVLEHPDGGYNDVLTSIGLALRELAEVSLLPAMVADAPKAETEPGKRRPPEAGPYAFRRPVGGAGGSNGSRRP